jgi:hypothetical protein
MVWGTFRHEVNGIESRHSPWRTSVTPHTRENERRGRPAHLARSPGPEARIVLSRSRLPDHTGNGAVLADRSVSARTITATSSPMVTEFGALVRRRMFAVGLVATTR